MTVRTRIELRGDESIPRVQFIGPQGGEVVGVVSIARGRTIDVVAAGAEWWEQLADCAAHVAARTRELEREETT